MTDETVENLYKELQTSKDKTASVLVSLTMNQAVTVTAGKAGWISNCHSHSSDKQLTVLSGKYFFNVSSEVFFQIHNENVTYIIILITCEYLFSFK